MSTLVIFILLLFAGSPIGVVLLLSSAVFAVASGNIVLFLSFPSQLFSGIDNLGLVAIPILLFLGEIMNASGITHQLVSIGRLAVGTARGGMAYINVLVNIVMASILGSAAAQIAIMSRVMVPEMEKDGYDKNFAAATTVMAGLLSPIIPPSLMFIVYGALARVPVGDIFIAGIVPGLMLGIGFAVTIFFIGLIKPFPASPPQSSRELMRDARVALSSLIVPTVIVGAIVGGLASPTEAAAISCAIAGLIGFLLTRKLRLSDLPGCLLVAARNSAMVLLVVAAANVFSWVLIYGQVPQAVSRWIQLIAEGPVSFMLLVNLLLLLIGTVIDGVPGLIMTVPILLPIATEIYGIDPIHFGVVISINLVLGLVSPPVGIALFVAAATTGLKPGRIFVHCLPFMAVALLLLVAISVWPQFTLFLVRLAA